MVRRKIENIKIKWNDHVKMTYIKIMILHWFLKGFHCFHYEEEIFPDFIPNEYFQDFWQSQKILCF